MKAVTKQILNRFEDFRNFEKIDPNRLFGVGCDSSFFVFIRRRSGRLEVEKPVPVTPQTVDRLFRVLVSLGARGLSYTSDNLRQHFSFESHVACLGIHRIYQVILDTKNVKALTFFRQWQIFFGEVCGYDVHGSNNKIRALGEHYQIKSPQAAPSPICSSFLLRHFY